MYELQYILVNLCINFICCTTALLKQGGLRGQGIKKSSYGCEITDCKYLFIQSQTRPLVFDRKLRFSENKTKDWALVHERGLGKWTVSLE